MFNEFKTFQNFIDSLTDLIVVLNPDSGAIVAVNNIVCQTLSYSKQELLALNILNLNPGNMEQGKELFDPDYEQGRPEKIKCNLKTKSGEIISVDKMENMISIKDKTYLVISANEISHSNKNAGIQDHIKELKDKNKELDHSLAKAELAFLATEAENKKRLEALYNERQNLYNMLDNLPVAFHLQAPDYSVPFANKMFQERFGSPEKKPCYDLMHKRKEPCEVCSPFKVFDTNETESSIWTSLDGHTYLTVVTPYKDIDGGPLVMEMAVDISQQKKAEEELIKAHHLLESKVAQRTAELAKTNEELKRSNQALNDFSAIASHDLGEPLRKIITFGNLLKNSATNLTEQETDYLLRMENGSIRMKRFIQDLLEYSQVHLKPKPFEPLNLDTEIQEVLSDLEIRMVEVAGKVETENLPAFEADKLQIRQLFQNLIGNSLKFHQKGIPPVITISCRLVENGFLEISVQDNGIGFEEKYIDKVFKPFERLNGRSAYEGSGMGLAICKKIVERHNGTLNVNSTLGEGTIFKITLPQKQSPSS